METQTTQDLSYLQTGESEWDRFTRYFEKIEGFKPSPRDSHAKQLYQYFLAGVVSGLSPHVVMSHVGSVSSSKETS